MKISLLKVAALAVCVSGATAQAQSGFGPYQAPAKWNRFNAPQDSRSFVGAVAQGVQSAADGEEDFAELPAPLPQPPLPQPLRPQPPRPEPRRTESYHFVRRHAEPGRS